MAKTLVVLLLVVISFAASGQPVLPADSALATFRNLYPQEKIFVQTNKSSYAAGETVWMKAWCVLEEAPSFLSRIVYFDLVNASGVVLEKKMYRLDSLSSTGAEFSLPDSLVTGTYAINAYTLWMLNFPSYLFQKNIFIYNGSSSGIPAAKKPKPSFTVQFFPEGGDLIAGVSNRIAFKAVQQNGLPCAVIGDILDKTGKKLASIYTEHDGMGSFDLDVDEANSYTAVITGNGGGTQTLHLPKPKSGGIALRIENTNSNKLFVLINCPEKDREIIGRVKVVAVMNYQVVFSQELDLRKDELACAINKKSLPAGLLYITIFNQNHLPIAERLAFNENYTFHAPEMMAGSLVRNANGKYQMDFRLDSIQGASLSCLVTQYIPADSVERFSANIASALLITGDLPGYVHHPGFYITEKGATTRRSLDLLLMTQGWRRFSWKKIQQNEFAALVYPVESAISLRGTVTKSDSREPVREGKVSFIIKGIDSTTILAEAGITDQGAFLLRDIHFKKSAVVAYMGTSQKKEKAIVDVHLQPTYLDSLRTSAHFPVIRLDPAAFDSTSSQYKLYLANAALWQKKQTPAAMDAVVIKTKKRSSLDSLNQALAGGPFLMGKAIDPATFKHSRSIWQIIQEAVPGVTVEGNPFDPVVSFNRFGALGSGSAAATLAQSSDGEISQSVVMESGGIAYFLNEVNVPKDVINTLNVEDVALIKVLKNEAAALGASEGAIAIYTKQGGVEGGVIYDKQYKRQIVAGYSVSREFYRPVNADSSAGMAAEPPYTLYWNAKLAPEKDGTFKIRFSMPAEKARLVIQGIDSKGRLIYKEWIIDK